LPRAIHIRELEQVPLGFNPHHNIVEKTYQYVLSLKRQLPFEARYIWYYRRPIDKQKLEEALAVFVGEHDFRSFCSSEYTGNTIRKIHAITLERVNDNYVITFKAPGFLRYMIRRIVGACLYVASHKLLTIDDLKTTLINKNPEHTLESAPARGLTLLAVLYKAVNHHDRVGTVD
jgi:tRNA pseudouridine38-40 synthase